MGGTTKARQLGTRLRAERIRAGYSNLSSFAQALGKDRSTIYRWELGKRTPTEGDVASYLVTVGADRETVDELVRMVRGAGDPVWLSHGKQSREQQMAALLDLEQEARVITDVSPHLVPGLLQTSDYARAIMHAATRAGMAMQEVSTRVSVRVGRRDVLTRSKRPPHLHAFIGEAVLRRHIGGRDVLREQLRYLLQQAELPTVTLRVIPDSGDWTPADEGNFVLIEPANGDPAKGVVHTENRLTGLFFQEEQDVEAYRQALALIEEVAMSPTDSAELIATSINELEQSP